MHGLDIILCFQLRQTREIYKESKEPHSIIPRFQKTQPKPLILDQVIGVNTEYPSIYISFIVITPKFQRWQPLTRTGIKSPVVDSHAFAP